MTPLERDLCAELRTLRTLRQELAGNIARLDGEVRTARQVEALLTAQTQALMGYLLTCGPEATEAVAALCQERDPCTPRP